MLYYIICTHLHWHFDTKVRKEGEVFETRYINFNPNFDLFQLVSWK